MGLGSGAATPEGWLAELEQAATSRPEAVQAVAMTTMPRSGLTPPPM
jgi:hypothetical protein